MADESYCTAGCGRLATEENWHGMIGPDAYVELVCSEHKEE